MPSRRLVLLAVAALLCSLQCSHAYWLPFGTSTTRLTSELARAACRGQGTRSVCWPTNLPDQYLDCDHLGMGQARRCPRGTLYDYVRRACVDSDQARPCPWWPVPRPLNVGLPSANNTGGPALSAPYGTFGRPGNETIDLPIAGTFLVFCPVMGHGPLGQNVEVVVSCPAPHDRTPYTHIVDLETITTNADVYPRRVASVRAFCGDKLHVRWQANFHLAQVFNLSPYARSANSDQVVMSRPPQPVYQCPTWRYEPAPPPAPAGSIRLVPNPGDEILVAPTRAPGNFTYQPETTGEFFIADASAAYCRLGMVFKLTVRPYPPFYAPVTYNISWSIDMDNYPDMTIFLGDRVHFRWTSPNQNVAILRVANLTMISPDPQPSTCRPPTRGLKDLVRGFYGIIAQGDFSGLLLNLADDFTVESNFRAPEIGFTGRYDRSTMIDFLILLVQRFNLTSFELVRFIEEGDTVITYQHWVGSGADYGRGLDTTVVQRWVFRDDNKAYMLREFTEAANMASILYPNNTCTPQGKIVIDCNYVPGPVPSPRPFGPGGKRL